MHQALSSKMKSRWNKTVGKAPCSTSQQNKSVWVRRSRQSCFKLKHCRTRLDQQTDTLVALVYPKNTL